MSASPVASSHVQFRYRFGTAEFDEARFELRVAGTPVAVQRKPLELLGLLLAQAGEVVTKDELLGAVWDGRPTVENVVANAVTKLRAALGEDNAARIVTVARIGYRFDGPLVRVAVGRGLPSVLGLQAGEPVPSRPSFQLEERLGRSDSNEVWCARHVKTREPRVFKFCTEARRLSMLKREVTLSRLLQDQLGERAAAFAKVIDWNFDTPPFFLECEYGGEDLLRWNEAGKRLDAMPLGERLGLFVELADAVAAAHGVGVLHKDLKPANILLSEEDGVRRLRLADFGGSLLLDPQRLAELGITRLGFTMTGTMRADSLAGTPLYVAPEIIAGQPPSAASDVYSLGVILFQLVVGDLQRPMAPGWERGVADPLLRSDIARATDGDVGQRLAAADELARLVRELPARQDRGRAVDAGVQREAARARRRSWLRFGAAAFAGMLLVGVVAIVGRDGLDALAMRSADPRQARIFYAEVADVYRHYLFTGEELVSDPADAAFRLQLSLAKYGEAPFTRAEVEEVGLAHTEIPLAMELPLLIRNNDLRIADVLADGRGDAASLGPQVETLRARVKRTRDAAYSLLEALHRRDPTLGALPAPPRHRAPEVPSPAARATS